MIAALQHLTYMVRHNPNCPSPFEVRVCGEAGLIAVDEPRNFVGYGATADKAAAQVLLQIEGRKVDRFWRDRSRLFSELWDGL